MRYAMIMAGGSGTRLWPMSRRSQPKQLIPFIGGRTLLGMAWSRLQGLLPADRVLICASDAHREAILQATPDLTAANWVGEPEGRDTLNAVGLTALLLSLRDSEAVFAVVTADHLIGPDEAFQGYLDHAFRLVEREPGTLVTFGIRPTEPATGFGYLQLGDEVEGGVRIVRRFREKPDAARAREFYDAGPERYLWNSGMFVWRADTLLDCIARYTPDVRQGLSRIGAAIGTADYDRTLAEVYPTLRKISIDYAVMEPASQDERLQVLGVPMQLEWLDVGSWPAYARTLEPDEAGNRAAGGRAVLLDCRDTLVVSGVAGHIVAMVGCEGMMVVHTPEATLICPADRAEEVKRLTAILGDRYDDAPL